MADTRTPPVDPEREEEQDVLRRCMANDPRAYGILVHRYMKRAYATALGLVGNHDDALDLSQEAFVRAYRALPRFDLNMRFYTWYYTILRNLCLNHLRDRARFARGQDDSDGAGGNVHDLRDVNPDPSVLAERNDMHERLWKAMAALRAEDREILLMKEQEECSYKEIAARLGLPIGTVMSRLFHARRRLKELLDSLL